MGKYRQARKPQYVPLTRFTIARSIDDLPIEAQKTLKKLNARLDHISSCIGCGEDALLVFEVTSPKDPRRRGTAVVCGNPKCMIYGEVESDFSSISGRD